MADAILVLNAGSSSLKFSVFLVDGADGLALDSKGQIEGIGTQPRLIAKAGSGEKLAEDALPADEVAGHAAALSRLGDWLGEQLEGHSLVAVGHRVVHGGVDYGAPAVIDDAVIARLEGLVSLAPLHQPHNLAGIQAVREKLPDLPQVACFDTAFHRGHPEVADRFAIPDALYQEGIRRYGFHGLSYEYIAQQLPEVAPDIAKGRVVIAHLGSGASMCAIKDGHSIESTMGFTALDGLPMGTRCGALDPGVLLFLMAEKGYGIKDLERLLYHDCGLKGLSDVSNDVRDLLASEAPMARLALDYFVHRIARELGALAASIEGLDAVVFTAGIGENSPEIRERVCRKAAWLGIDLDEAANAAGKTRISKAGSAVSVWVVPTDEEKMIALHTWKALQGETVTGAGQAAAS